MPEPAAPVEDFGLPPRDIAGKPNPAYYRGMYALVNKIMLTAIAGGDKIPFNFEAALAGIDKEAKASGFDPKVLRDTRSKEQIVGDAINRLAENPPEVWELLDEEAEAIENAMDSVNSGAMEYIDERRKKTIPKAVGGLLKRIRKLRHRARTPVCQKQIKAMIQRGRDAHDLKKAALDAAWPIRMMLYCGRSNMPHLANADRAASVYMIGKHHVKMACDVWEARRGVRFGPPREKNLGESAINLGEKTFKGCFLIAPPGHGKTEIGRFVVASMYVENPHHQAMLNHAVNEKSLENLTYLASLFKDDNAAGRRFRSLFPNLRLNQCSGKKFRIDLGDHHKSPSATASGVHSAVSGSNASIQWWDDPVDQSEASEPTQREQTFTTLNGTWLTRMRGNKGWFLLCTATLWHKADAVSRFIETAEKSGFRVSIQRCGGPKTTPAFESLWQEVYPAKELRSRYEAMRNPSLYSAAYMANPVAEERRIVRTLRLYDPDSDEHRAFVEGSTKYLSLDPAATRGQRSDMAGVIYSGLGFVRVQKAENGKVVEASERRLRVLSADPIPATQVELVEYVVGLTQSRTIDYVLVETRSGFHGTADMFENYHGIDVIRIDPRNKDKEERLRAAAPALEDGNAHLNLRAVVEFPGVRTGRKMADGSWELTMDPRMKQLEEEIRDFGACATDNMLDALTQKVIYLSPELGVGSGGIVNRQVANLPERKSFDPRIDMMLKEAENRVKRDSAMSEEDRWIKANWSMPNVEMPSGGYYS